MGGEDNKQKQEEVQTSGDELNIMNELCKYYELLYKLYGVY